MKNRGQVTLFIILGVIILIIVALYISFSAVWHDSEYQVDDFGNIRYFMESYLDIIAEEAVLLVGQRGGYTYGIDSLEGLSHSHGGENIAIGIYMTENHYGSGWVRGDSFFARNVSTYPWDGFSSPSSNHYSNTYKLGKPTLPTLHRTTASSSTTVRREMEKYVEELITASNVATEFQHEYDIEFPDEAEATVTIGERSILFEVDYPFNISTKRRANQKTLGKLSTEVPIVEFEKFYNFIEESIGADTSAMDYDIQNILEYKSLPSYKDDFRVNVQKDAAGDYSDLIIFTYNNSGIGKYYFKTFRNNRIPAMYDFVPRLYEVDMPFPVSMPQFRHYDLEGVDINYHHYDSDPFASHSDEMLNYIHHPHGIDPDKGDELSYTYGRHPEPSRSIDFCPGTECCWVDVTDSDSGDFEIDCPNRHINLKEYQCDLRSYVTDQANQNPKDYDHFTIEYTCDECIDPMCGACYECCEGCCMAEQCCDPDSAGCICTQTTKDRVEPDSFPASASSSFLEVNDITDSWNGDCMEPVYCDITDDDDNVIGQEKCGCKYERCCTYCETPCGEGVGPSKESGHCIEY